MNWAYATAPPTPDPYGRREDARIGMHDGFGIFDLVFHPDAASNQAKPISITAAPGTGTGMSPETASRRRHIIRAHAVFMVRRPLPLRDQPACFPHALKPTNRQSAG